MTQKPKDAPNLSTLSQYSQMQNWTGQVEKVETNLAPTGVEPATSRLERQRSTAVLPMLTQSQPAFRFLY